MLCVNRDSYYGPEYRRKHLFLLCSWSLSHFASMRESKKGLFGLSPQILRQCVNPKKALFYYRRKFCVNA
jgi:hypothetical protein